MSMEYLYEVGDKKVQKSIVVMAVQLCEHIKKHSAVLFK